MKKHSKTNWEKVDSLADEEINYSDAPELDARFFQRAVPWPASKEQITLRLDPDLLDYFRRQGKGYQTAINAALRSHIEGQRIDPMGRDLLLPFEKQNFTPEYSEYSRVKRNNFFASIQSFSHIWKAFLLLDTLFLDEFADVENLRDSAQFLPLLLVIQAHSQLRIASELAFSNALTASGAVLRQSIESTAFAHKLYKRPELGSVWMSKDESKQTADEFHQTFVNKRRESLFSNHPSLEELYSNWCDLSELSSHVNLTSFGKRLTSEQSPSHVKWYLSYFETDRQALAYFLFTILHVGRLIENIFFSIFETRLQFDDSLAGKRKLSSQYVEQVRRELRAEFADTSPHEHKR
jgi:uncharacterized protein (DUF4415 family)